MLQCKTKNLYFKKKLGDLILFLRNGISNEQVDIYTDFPVTRIETIADGKIDYNRVGHVEKAPEDYRILQWDILVSNINSQKHIGKVAIKDDNKVLYHGMNLLLMRPNETIDSKFLFYVLNFNKQYFERIASPAVNQSSINQIDMQKMEFIIPKDKSKQEQIANILSTCDEVIEKTEETIEKYKQIKAGMMQDLFTRGLDANGKLRPTYTQAPDLYKYSKELDRHIPKEWDVKRLDEIGEMKSGDGITAKNIFITGIYPVYGGNGLRGYTSNYTHEGEYVLIGRQGALCGNINKASGKFFASEHAVVVTLYDDNNVDWVFYKYTDLNLNQYSEASAQPGLSVQKISKIKIDIPKGPEQKNISIRLNLVDKKIKLEAEYLNKYKQIKQGLMKRLLTPPADAEIVEE